MWRTPCGFLTTDLSTTKEVTHMQRTVSLWHQPKNTLPLTHTQSRAMRESSNLPRFCLLFPKYKNRRGVGGGESGFYNSPFFTLALTGHAISAEPRTGQLWHGWGNILPSVLLSQSSHSDYCEPIWSDTRVSSSGLLAGRAPWAARRHHSPSPRAESPSTPSPPPVVFHKTLTKTLKMSSLLFEKRK